MIIWKIRRVHKMPMIHYSISDFKIEPLIFKKKGGTFDDNIFTFDIETVSLFKINDKWQPFDYNIKPAVYTDIPKGAVCYIWQFGVNDTVYYGRELSEFKQVLEAISDKDITRFIYIHNLSYEMQWLLDILDDYTIEDLTARNLRQPISFKINELNIIFRCSYMLTNLSLDAAAKKYAEHHKAVGDLDYNIAYSPISVLPDKALHYCEYDILTLYEIIKHFRDEYKHLERIPLTQTGCVRRSLNEVVDFYYHRRMAYLTPSAQMMRYLILAFQGGITHSNILYANRSVGPAISMDEASAYPFMLVAREYPIKPFYPIEEWQIDKYKKTHCILYHVRFKNVRSKYYNHYISYSKCINFTYDKVTFTDGKGREHSFKDDKALVDNGRLVSCSGSFEMVITDIDLELIKQSYEIEDIEYIDIYAALKGYLDKRVIKFILERYKAKTTLKNDKTQAQYYMKMKQELNSIFGCSCRNFLKVGITYDKVNGWQAPDIYATGFIEQAVDDYKNSYSNILNYPVGVWCTAYNRQALWSNILKLDKQVVYYDTDSIKYVGDAGNIFEEHNKEVLADLEISSIKNGIELDMYMPVDDKGKKRPLGVFEFDGAYKDFKTLGAKKYAYIEEDDSLHITVAGVSKSASKALSSLDEFKNGKVFNYKEANKLTHYYYDEQEQITYIDVQGNTYTSTQKHSVILQPTTYTLGITDEFEALINEYLGQLDYNF